MFGLRSHCGSDGRAGLQLMLGLAILSYVLIVMFPQGLALPTQPTDALPETAATAASAPAESRQVARRT
jgi:hypothetical protein